MNPVHKIFGYRVRMNFFEIHHLYHGLVGMAISIYGMYESVVLISRGFEASNHLAYVIGVLTFLVQLGALSVWTYVAVDDIKQHHAQVDMPSYHSPVHYWFHSIYKYKAVRWFTIKMDLMMANPVMILIVILFVFVLYLCVK